MITKEKALVALNDMDDYARMTLGVDAHGPRETLRRFIEQSGSNEAPVATIEGSYNERHFRWNPEAAAFDYPLGTKVYAAPESTGIALKKIAALSMDQFSTPYDMAEECVTIANAALTQQGDMS